MQDPKSLDDYIAMGAVNIEGVNKDGEFIFSVSEKAKDMAPLLWKAHTEYVDNVLIELLEKNLINVSYNENLEAFVELSDDGRAIVEELGLYPLDDE
jgi:hypothetical protein